MRKLASILLSFLIAFSLWYYVISVVSPGSEETFYNIPVVLENESALEDRGLMITSIGSTSVTLKLSGNRSDLNKLNASNITIKANLATIYDPGESIQLDYTIAYPGTVANNAFVEESRTPSTVSISVEKRDYKDVPVVIDYAGAVPAGYTAKVDEETLDLEAVRISGPHSVVSTIEQARIEVDLTDQTETIDQSFKVTLCDADGEPVDASLITAYQNEVNLRLPILKVKSIPLKLNVIDGGGATEKTTSITIEPQAIRVCGTAAALEDLKEIVLGTVDLAEYEKEAELSFDINIPENVTNMTGVTKADVKIEFPQLSTRTIKISNIEMLNVPEGLEAELMTQQLDVTVRGPKDLIAKLTEADISVKVDLTGAEIGTINRKVQITLSDTFSQIGALGNNYSVYIQIDEIEPEEK